MSPKGSCCDNGRFIFKDCNNWWYNCKEYGLINSETWLLFTSQERFENVNKNQSKISSYSFPVITEHQGRCKYSKRRKKCPIPINCKNWIPNEEDYGMKKVCDEIPKIDKIP